MNIGNAWQVGESTLISINSLARIGLGLVEAHARFQLKQRISRTRELALAAI